MSAQKGCQLGIHFNPKFQVHTGNFERFVNNNTAYSDFFKILFGTACPNVDFVPKNPPETKQPINL